MSNAFKTGLVVAVLMMATTAMASNFRAADQVYIPAAGFLSGASGTFISDVFVSNVNETESVTVSVVFSAGAGGAQQTFNNLFTLAPRERREFINFIQNTLNLPAGSFGQLIFNACLAGADCTQNTQDDFGISPFFRDITVQSRIYSIPPGTSLSQNPPTTGQLFAGVPWYHYVSQEQSASGLDRVFITGLRNTGAAGQAGTYRGNIGLVNASQFSSTTIAVKLFDTRGNQIGSEFTTTLQPLGHTQFTLGSMFPAFTGSTATGAYVTVEQRNSTPTSNAPQSCQPNGCPGFFAYGSVLDNLSGDATTMEAQYLRKLSDAAQIAVYGSGAGKTTMRRAVRH